MNNYNNLIDNIGGEKFVLAVVAMICITALIAMNKMDAGILQYFASVYGIFVTGNVTSKFSPQSIINTTTTSNPNTSASTTTSQVSTTDPVDTSIPSVNAPVTNDSVPLQ